MSAAVHLVVPAEVDDPGEPSGGNVYDLELAHALARAGHEVHRHRVAARGRSAGEQAEDLAALLTARADGEVVVVDGLLLADAAGVLEREHDRLAVVPLLHLPTSVVDDSPEVLARERRLLRAAAGVVTTSEWSRRWLERVHPGLAVDAAPPGVRTAPATTPGDGTRLTCVAAVVPAKGQDVLVAALATLTDLPWTCRVVGPLGRDATFVAGVREALRENGLDGRVRLAGALDRTEVAAALAATDLLVLPTRHEVYGMVLTEALARAVPVVASAVGGVPEAVGRTPDGRVPGALVPPDDPDALAAALRDWLSDGGLRDRRRAAAAVRREHLDGWDATARAVADALASARVNREAPTAVVSG